MRIETAKAIVEAADDLGLDGLSLRENYSGRCMYGRTTCGVRFGWTSDFIRSVAHAAILVKEKEDEEGAVQTHAFVADLRVSIDAMGTGYIAY